MSSGRGTRYLPGLVTLVLTFAASFLAYRLSRSHFQRDVQAEFDRASAERTQSIERAIRLRLLILESVHSMYVRARGEPRPEFRSLVEPLQNQLDGVQAIEWITRVKDEDRGSFEKARRAEGLPGFQITERESQGMMVRASRRAEYYPVFPIDASDQGDPSLGFDLGSNPKRREALERARNLGRMTASRRVTLVQEYEEGHYGFLAFAPVYATEKVPKSIAARRELLRGFVVGVFRLPDIIEEALQVFGPDGVAVSVHDDTAPAPERLLYSHRAHDANGDPQAATVFRPATRVASFHVGQRVWLVECAATPIFMAARPDRLSPTVLSTGIATGALLSIYLFLMARRSDALQSMATALEERNAALDVLNERTQSALEEKEVLLKEIHHRVKNNLQVVSSLLSLQLSKLAGPEALQALRETQGRVHSMALVHEHFYQSPNLDKLDYVEYMRDLVDHLLGCYEGAAGRVSVDVEGDSVRLPLEKATSVALIFNELVSNALKHAFPGTRTGRVRTKLIARDEGVRLVVGDDGVGLPADVNPLESGSLGLRIVSSLVQQLDGTLELRREMGTEFVLDFSI